MSSTIRNLSLFFASKVDYEHESYPTDCDIYHRMMAGKKLEIDFSVFSVAVFTLTILLFVELLRHLLDIKTHNHPFATTVLEVVYQELSTLGIVEGIIFLVHKYYSNLDVEKEMLFAEVHFMLFYTALLNAIQTCITAITSSRISKKLWTKSEAMDIDHYIAIRKEFDEIETKFESNYDDMAEEFLDFNWKKRCKKLLQSVTKPLLARRRNALLTVVRFHELRVHFLKANKLPPTFRVSEYLILCEISVFKKLAHISTPSWLVLIGFLDFIYFLMGIIVTKSKNQYTVGKALSILYVGLCISFVILSWVLLQKMKWAFSKIMHKQFIDVGSECTADNCSKSDESSKRGFGRRYPTQLHLFWGHEPRIIILMIKSMQFCYALLAGVILVFWNDIGVELKYERDDCHPDDYLFIQSRYFVLSTLLLCYYIFNRNASMVIPRYTLCTSLGELVHSRLLSHSLSKFRLHEQIWMKQLQAEMINEKSSIDKVESYGSLQQIAGYAQLSTGELPMTATISERQTRRKSWTRSLSDGVAAMKLMKDAPKLEQQIGEKNVINEDGSKDVATMKALRRQNRKSARAKSRSEGVRSMRDMQIPLTTSFDNKAGKSRDDKSKDIERMIALRKQNRKSLRTKSRSEGVQSMRDMQSSLSRIDEKKEGVKGMSSKRNSSNPSLSSLIETSTNDEKFEYVSKKSGLSSWRKVLFLEKNGPSETDTVMSNMSSTADDEASDYGDIPEAHSVIAETEKFTFALFLKKIRKLYETKSYQVFDDLVVTLFCLFLIGMRVEVHAVESGIISKSENSLDIPLHDAFWIELGFFVYILVSSSFFILTFIPVHSSPKRNEYLVAETFDIILTSSCLIILIISEFRRCCDESSEFGGYVGLGSIEPYTCIIIVRPFRNAFGRAFFNLFSKNKTNKTLTSESFVNDDKLGSIRFSGPLDQEKLNSAGVPNNSTSIHSKSHHDGHGHGNPKEDAIKAWMDAVSQHPDIVETYGMFSSELLQSMLGIDVIAEEGLDKAHTSMEDRKLRESDKNLSTVNNVLKKKNFKKLDAVARAVIVAGRIGRPMKLVERQSSNVSEYGSDDDKIGKIADLRSYEESDAASYVTDNTGENFVQSAYSQGDILDLKAPNARLIRSLRRCERRMPPFLDSWSLVDAVMTKHEILFLDTHIDNEDSVLEKAAAKRESVRKAMHSTHGGKGLLIQDAACGRTVIGHVNLASIARVNVELKGQVKNNSGASTEKEECKTVNGLPKHYEYWTIDSEGIDHELLKNCWSKSTEVILKIETSSEQTILLRFCCDLDQSEKLNEFVAEAENVQSKFDLLDIHAFLWCHTIARINGPDHLQQDLPNYGKDTNEELSDYIIAPKARRRSMLMTLRGTGIDVTKKVRVISKSPSQKFKKSSSFSGDSEVL